MPESRRASRRAVALAAALCWVAPWLGLESAGAAQDRATPVDPLAPTTRPQDGLAGPLHTATVCTASLEESRLFYGKALGMRFSGPIAVPRQDRRLQRALWQIPEGIGWDMYLLRREGVDAAMQVRLLVLDRPGPAVHRSWSAAELGPFSLGFPNVNQTRLDAWVRRHGYGTLNTEIDRGTAHRPDGSGYSIDETIFNGPDFVHAVGIHRGDGMPQLGPTSPVSGMGGPAYSAQIVADSDAWIRFLVDGLGMELRSDRQWKSSGTKGALNLPDGTEFRFSIVYAHGARSGHILLMDYSNLKTVDMAAAPRPPNRGLCMWSLPVRDMARAMANLARMGVPIVHAPIIYHSPAFGLARVVTVLAPNGFLIELFEPMGRSR